MVTATTWFAPEAYRQEYESYKKSYLEGQVDKDLVFAYIFLQIYLEVHFHYYLRFLIGGGFGAGPKVSDWNEKAGVPQKLKRFKVYLESKELDFNPQWIEDIITDYESITHVRNLLIHGHPITRSVGDGQSNDSEARTHLERARFNEMRLAANRIAHNWNLLMLNLKPYEHKGVPGGNFLENCMFEVF